MHLSRRSFPFITKASADSGYIGERPATVTSISVEIVYKEVIPGFGFTRLRPVDITQERGLLIDTLLTRDDNSRFRIESFFA